MTERPTFPLNAWYAAAWDVDVRRALLPRTHLQQEDRALPALDGRAVALEDACWHRLVPLSNGAARGRRRRLRLSRPRSTTRKARCIFMPSQETINPSACVRAFRWWRSTASSGSGPATRRWPIRRWSPTCTGTTIPEWAGDGETIHVNCDYRLVVDNLMDLTHETFVHGSSIGNTRVAEAPFDVTHGDRTATVTRWMRDIDPPPFWAGQLRQARQGRPLADHPLRGARARSPSTWAWRRPAPARREGDRSQGVNGYVLNTITPETDTTCHLLLGLRAQLPPRASSASRTELRDGVAAFSARTR